MSKKNTILLAATVLFSQNGFKGASMSDLSKMTGAASGTIFHHFKNKEDLFLNILRDIKETILNEFQKYQQDHQFHNGMELVEGAISFYLNLSRQMHDQFIILHRHFPYKMAATNSICREYLESIYNCLLDIFEKGITIGQEDGSIRTVQTRHSAMILFSMVDGIVRYNTYGLYDAGALYNELMASCRNMLSKNTAE